MARVINMLKILIGNSMAWLDAHDSRIEEQRDKLAELDKQATAHDQRIELNEINSKKYSFRSYGFNPRPDNADFVSYS